MFAYALAMAAASAPAPPVQLAQLSIRQRVVIRIPASPLAAPPARFRWKEKKGPKCIPMRGLSAAAVMRPDAIDLVLRGGLRLRAELDDECPALDFYRGFYLVPSDDGQVCARRDTIHSRSGGQCGIDRFRTLVSER